MGKVIDSGWKGVARQILDVIYPPLCIACREHVSEPDSLCPECWRTLHFLDGPVCAACGLPFEIDPGEEMLCAGCLARPPAFDKARAVLRYDDASRKPILALKNMDRLDLAPAFGRWLERAGRELLVQFLIEASLLSVLGGAMGLVLGYGVSAVLSYAFLGSVSAPPLWAFACAFLVPAAIGIAFGLYPAWKASRLDPIECLRYE